MHGITGFIVVDKAGDFVAFAGDISAAKARLDVTDEPQASRVLRCADGITMAYRHARKRAPGDVWGEAGPA